MGFVNINGNQVHTSAISNGTWTSGSSGTYSASTIGTTIGTTNGLVFSPGTGTYTIQAMKITYHVLGEDVEVSGYRDSIVAIMVAQLNVLGKPFYDELKKQDIFFPMEIEDFLKKKFEIEETAKQFIKYTT